MAKNKLNRFIVVPDECKANKLHLLGFNYILETLNGKQIYKFVLTKELSQVLNSQFSGTDYFEDKKLRF